jgi:23S rRNA (cytidine1920-2'-O)/16S rRNA (cytidine1409-2'-O)-methyltransferase
VKKRADLLMVERGLAESRTRAAALILAGKVFSGERRVEKAGELLADSVGLELRGQDHPWVSRGGVKLAFALNHFSIDPAGRICLDVGASTGGFTHVLLERGAAKVYAVDVGHGQLAWKLRQEPRVIVLERMNARNLSRKELPEPPSLIVCDASFIGLATVLERPLSLATEEAEFVALIKPQFEVGRDAVGKGGIVRDADQRRRACERVADWLASRPGWCVLGLTESPITGTDGNIEYLIAARHAD